MANGNDIGEFCAFFSLSLSLSRSLSLSLCFLFFFFACRKVLVAPLAQFLWALAPSTPPPAPPMNIYAKHSYAPLYALRLLLLHSRQLWLLSHPVPSRPRLLGVFSYCWLRYAKCALMHFTTLYGTFPGAPAPAPHDADLANVNYGKLMRICICGSGSGSDSGSGSMLLRKFFSVCLSLKIQHSAIHLIELKRKVFAYLVILRFGASLKALNKCWITVFKEFIKLAWKSRVKMQFKLRTKWVSIT